MQQHARVVRGQGLGLGKPGQGVPRAAQVERKQSQGLPGPGKGRAALRRAPETQGGLLGEALGQQGPAKIKMGLWRVGPRGKGPAYELCPGLGVAGLQGAHAQQVQGAAMLRLQREDFPAEGLGPLVLALLVEREGHAVQPFDRIRAALLRILTMFHQASGRLPQAAGQALAALVARMPWCGGGVAYSILVSIFPQGKC